MMKSNITKSPKAWSFCAALCLEMLHLGSDTGFATWILILMSE